MLQGQNGQPLQYPRPSQPTPGAPAGNAGMAAPPATPPAAPPPAGGGWKPQSSAPSQWQGQATQAGMNAWNNSPANPQSPNNPANANQPPGEGYGPGYGEAYGKEHIGQLDQPSMLEQFAQQQLQGNNPYYDRLRQQGEAAINQQMIARGLGSSGGALSALGNFDAGLYADQFNNMGNLLGQASNMGMNRQQLGYNEASGIQGLQQQRTGQQFGEAAQIAGLGAGINGAYFNQGGQLSGDAAMAGLNARANAAGIQGQGQNAMAGLGLDAFKAYMAY